MSETQNSLKALSVLSNALHALLEAEGNSYYMRTSELASSLNVMELLQLLRYP